MPEETLLVDDLQPAKRSLVIEVFKLIPEVKSVTFEETYRRKEAKGERKVKLPSEEAKPEPGEPQKEGR